MYLFRYWITTVEYMLQRALLMWRDWIVNFSFNFTFQQILPQAISISISMSDRKNMVGVNFGLVAVG